METQLSIMDVSFTAIQTNVMSAIAIIAPIAITILGIIIIWSFATNFFKRIGK